MVVIKYVSMYACTHVCMYVRVYASVPIVSVTYGSDRPVFRSDPLASASIKFLQLTTFTCITNSSFGNNSVRAFPVDCVPLLVDAVGRGDFEGSLGVLLEDLAVLGPENAK